MTEGQLKELALKVSRPRAVSLGLVLATSTATFVAWSNYKNTKETILKEIRGVDGKV